MMDISICVAGATGKMGISVLKEAALTGVKVVGAVEKDGHEKVGRTLTDAGICSSDVIIQGSSSLSEALDDADVFITFTTPLSELENIPKVVRMKKRIVMGTTGFSRDERARIEKLIQGKVPAVISTNYSIGVNVLFKLSSLLSAFPKGYDISLFEIHHTGKVDSPSGTAKTLEEILSHAREYTESIHGREGTRKRLENELEIFSSRLGGVPGIHDVIIAGPHEMLKLEHTAFSRKAFASGALHAAKWIGNQNEPRIYTMMDILEI